MNNNCTIDVIDLADKSSENNNKITWFSELELDNENLYKHGNGLTSVLYMSIEDGIKEKYIYIVSHIGRMICGYAYIDFNTVLNYTFVHRLFTINNNIGKLGFKGVGTDIMNKIIEISKKKGKNGIFLSPLEEAEPFYNKFGFHYIDTELYRRVFILQFDEVPLIPMPSIDSGTRRRSRSKDCRKRRSRSKDCRKRRSKSKDCRKRRSKSKDCRKRRSKSKDCRKRRSKSKDCRKRRSRSKDCRKRRSKSKDCRKRRSKSKHIVKFLVI